MKVLHLDIETAPNLAHVWGLWQQNVALSQLMAPGYVLCWAAKWDGGREVFFDSEHQSSRRTMLQRVHKLLSEADIVVTYNGASFDLPTLNAEFVQQGMTPPSPYQHVDLLLAVRKRFRFPSNKLEYVSKALGVGSKVKHEGHPLWVACMNGEDRAWQRMRRYNENDVRLQERLYRRILGWIPNHPNHALYVDSDRPCCPNCGGTRLKSNGLRRTAAQVYRRYLCLKCGAWSRDTKKEHGAVTRRAT